MPLLQPVPTAIALLTGAVMWAIAPKPDAQVTCGDRATAPFMTARATALRDPSGATLALLPSGVPVTTAGAPHQGLVPALCVLQGRTLRVQVRASDLEPREDG